MWRLRNSEFPVWLVLFLLDGAGLGPVGTSDSGTASDVWAQLGKWIPQRLSFGKKGSHI